jgi:hypothetical protein
LGGVVLVLAGLGIAAYTVPLSGNDEPGAAGPPEPPAQGGAQWQATVAAVDPEDQATAAADKQAAVKPAPPAPAKAAQPPPRPRTSPSPPTELVATPRRIPLSQPVSASGPLLDRVGLAREIQRHLRRVGCYSGEVTGVWSPAARRAMKAFTDRVNATLPVDEPDYILLAMVQNHQDKACGRGCPAGEHAAEDGRCLPNAIVAQSGRKLAAPDAPLHTKAGVGADAAADPASVPQGRMALAGPKAEEAPPGRTLEPDGRTTSHPDRPAKRPAYADGGRWESGYRDRRRPPRGSSNRVPSWAAAAFGYRP